MFTKLNTVKTITTKALLNFEEEERNRAEVVQRCYFRSHTNDLTVFGEFNERKLIVKPRVLGQRDWARDKGPASKLYVTLESKSSVDSIIFFNRDLTHMQAEQAYLRRIVKRSAFRDQPTVPTRPFR